MITQNARKTGRRKYTGVVIARSGNKTVKVLVERRYRHPRYEKEIRRSKKYLVHDENNQAKIGDKVVIIETRPLSKMKRWCIVDILGKGGVK